MIVMPVLYPTCLLLIDVILFQYAVVMDLES